MPPVFKKFTAKAVSFNSLMIAVARGESLQPAQEQSAKTSGRRRERLADAHGSATPRPPGTMKPAATPPKGLSVPAKRNSFCRRRDAPTAGFLSFPTASTAALVSLASSSIMRSWSLDFASGSTVAASTTSIPPDTSSEVFFVVIRPLTCVKMYGQRCAHKSRSVVKCFQSYIHHSSHSARKKQVCVMNCRRYPATWLRSLV